MDDFLLRALLGGIGIACMAGPLGSLILWQRMAWFGDTLAHGALLGIALGLATGVDIMAGVLAVGLVMALVLILLRERQVISSDAVLGIMAHATLATGLIVLGFMEQVRVDLTGYLFGDILAISHQDLLILAGAALAVPAGLALLWKRLLAITLDEDMARVEGIPVVTTRLAFVCLTAVTVAVAMKLVGILLLSALLIIPAALARRLARTPESMAVMAAAAGIAAVTLGLYGSVLFDLPTGPAIVVAATLMFVAGQVLQARKY
ncbi:MAG: metal ABC transporter permease [Pseudomonadota bacterium]|nr:metal ABC transporter permease [Pseudomonadota bacterium]